MNILAKKNLAIISRTFFFSGIMIHLELDEGIRNWVLFPLLFMMITIAILRHNISKLLGPAQKPSMVKKSFKSIQQQEVLARAARFRIVGSILHKDAWNSRKVPLLLFNQNLTVSFNCQNLYVKDLLTFPENPQNEDPLNVYFFLIQFNFKEKKKHSLIPNR